MKISPRDIIDLLTALAALIAAIQSWRSHGEVKRGNVALAAIQRQESSQNVTVTVGGRDPSARATDNRPRISAGRATQSAPPGRAAKGKQRGSKRHRIKHETL